MTWATQITICRILLIPVFVGALLYYNLSAEQGSVQEWYRWAAVAAFVVASVSDAVDGWVARRFNQKSELGSALDPLADKALLLSALITLSIVKVPGLGHLPLWFLVTVLGRDAILVLGYLVLHLHDQQFKIRAHWTGKVATALQMAVVAIILLKWQVVSQRVLVLLAAVFTVISLMVYIFHAIHTVNEDLAKPTGDS